MSRLAGSGILARAHLRSAWRTLVSWPVLMAGLVVATGWSISGLYPTPAAREQYAASAGLSPAVAAFNGRGYELTDLGGIVGYEVGFLALIGFPMVAVHLAVRFTRREEDAGRTELVTAGRVGRLAPLAAACLVIGAALAGFVVLTGIGLHQVGLPVAGSWRYAATLGLFAAAHVAFGLLCAQVGRHSRTAYALGLIVALAGFLIRAVIDGRHWEATWATPSGWLAEVRPWGQPQGWPIAAFVALTCCCLALAAVVAEHRDLTGGLLAPRPGPARAAAALGRTTGPARRLTRGPLQGWLLGTTLWSVAFGALAGEMTAIASANPALLEVLGIERAEYLVTSLALLLCAIGAAGFGVQAMTRLAAEESAGRLGLLLSTRVNRARSWLSWWVVAVLGSGAVLFVAAAGLIAATARSTGMGAGVGSAVGATLTLVLPVVLVVSCAAVLQAALPRATPAGWLLVGWMTLVGMLAETLRLPEWSRQLSPVYAAGRVPIEPADTAALAVMALLCLGLVLVGLARFRRRDLLAG